MYFTGRVLKSSKKTILTFSILFRPRMVKPYADEITSKRVKIHVRLAPRPAECPSAAVLIAIIIIIIRDTIIVRDTERLISKFTRQRLYRIPCWDFGT